MNLGKRIEAERKRRGWTHAEVVALVPGLKQQTLDRLEKRDSRSSAFTLGIASAFGMTVEQLLSSNVHTADSQSPAVEGAQKGGPLALSMSHRMVPDEVPLLNWDDVVVGAKANEQFKTILPDDALGKDFPAGTEILWASPTKRFPKVGRQALVIDDSGQLHARWLGQGVRPGELTAVSPSPLYRSFDGLAQRFEVVAVFKAKIEPDDQ